MNDANGHGGGFGHLRGPIASCSGNDLEALLVRRSHKQGRKNALSTNALGKLL
jgi:hypothetical protein